MTVVSTGLAWFVNRGDGVWLVVSGTRRWVFAGWLAGVVR